MENLRERVLEIIAEKLELPHYKVFYFGSRAKGNSDARSDIDIGIEAPERIPLHVLDEIEAKLDELPVLQKFDLVDFRAVSEEFRRVALQNVEVICEK